MLVRVILADRAARLTALTLGLAVLTIIAMYAIATAWQADFWIASKVAGEIGLSRDRSMGEIVNYGLEFVACVLFLLSYFENRSPVLVFLSLLMAFIWFDDSARYHERIGALMVGTFGLPAFAGLRPQDTGEVVAWALAGLILALMLVLGLRHRRPGDRGVLVLVSFGFCFLLLCGVVVDLAHVGLGGHFELLASVIEDGGEMLAVVLITGVALGLSRNGRAYYEMAARRSLEATPHIPTN